MNKQEIVKLNHLHITPRKVRLIGDTIRGLSANEAEAQLTIRPQRAAKALLKLLRSGLANAVHNQKLNPAHMFISQLMIGPGPIRKSFMPRAQGRATPIQKKMSNILMVLEEKQGLAAPRFMIVPPKKDKKDKKKPVQKPKAAEPKKETPKKKAGFFKRMFSRKTGE